MVPQPDHWNSGWIAISLTPHAGVAAGTGLTYVLGLSDGPANGVPPSVCCTDGSQATVWPWLGVAVSGRQVRNSLPWTSPPSSETNSKWNLLSLAASAYAATGSSELSTSRLANPEGAVSYV